MNPEQDNTTAVLDELVVDTHHLGAVRHVLGELHIEDAVKDAIPEFDLTLLTLKHGDTQNPVTDLDPVLTEVRARIAGRSGGWTPLIGKNRKMGNVFGAYPQTKSQAFWNPMPATHEGPWIQGDAGQGVRVGMVDTKIYQHPQLPKTSVRASDHDWFTKDRQGTSHFEEGHGVFVAGLILKTAPGATVVPRAALGPDGKAEAWVVVKKLATFLADKPEDRVHLIVMANGCRTHDGQPPLILERAVERLSPHIAVVAAAGNHGGFLGMTSSSLVTRNSATWPAALPGVIAAGVPDLPDPDPTTHYSADLPWVTHIVQPEVDDTFTSTYLDSATVTMFKGDPATDLITGYATWRGTSCAAAYLGGLIAAEMPSSGMDAAQALARVVAGPLVDEFVWPRPAL
ncbi:S8/S53 family peptidase [Lentzea sp. NBC_00516]|uniref:S8/S53 family peptidase n=1 Tax=Lentzea sp. NBC_00516 TaxID=2903582 RepID=UPI002E7FFE77|nr:S8/S53 family peptidase [Lentzea sp. NBC_00516]WUD26413.1 S8/S53 family peptidase [Lentzea sp. NBC_00516]